MKKIITFAVIFGSVISLYAQEKKATEYNRWSLELNAGTNKAIKPFDAGYSSSNEVKYMSLSEINHFDLGIRYMLTPKFGLKFDLASDQIANQNGGKSLPFEVQQYRIGFQGVANAGKILGFEEFTKRVGLLAHAGVQASQISAKLGVNKGLEEYNGGVMFGLTPQFRLSNRFVFTADFTILSNVRQHLTWNGSKAAQAENLTGQMYTTSIGLTYYFGKNEKHADWYIQEKIATDPEVLKRLDQLDVLMKDTDRDGVLDHLDAQNNTPNGVIVDSKGRFIDINKNGTPDELEPKTNESLVSVSNISQSDAVKLLIEKGYVNVFYDVNKDEPNSGSINNVYYIIKFLKEYPESKASLTGYTDVKGNEDVNINLSQRRAQKLYNVIIANGIDTKRISINGNGVDKNFESTNNTSLGLARRVSIKLE